MYISDNSEKLRNWISENDQCNVKDCSALYHEIAKHLKETKEEYGLITETGKKKEKYERIILMTKLLLEDLEEIIAEAGGYYHTKLGRARLSADSITRNKLIRFKKLHCFIVGLVFLM